MNYNISLTSPLSHLLKITVEVRLISTCPVKFKLPIWRPGRYEAANYAKNIKHISFSDPSGATLAYQKTNSSTWLVHPITNKVIAEYEYYAHQLDAGNSWYDEDQVYINFINCLLFTDELLTEKCYLQCSFPDAYHIACGLKRLNPQQFEARSYRELVDSPLIASRNISKYMYESHGVPFSIWFQGDHSLHEKKVVQDFKKFTDYQINMMRNFPEKDYHFLNQVTSYKHYHGVEHANSTVICIGPGKELNTDHLYQEFLGVSSHELFHAWNILKIRPKELMPYDFSKPPIFPTGYVAEGFTTYYGDLILVKSGVFNEKWYFNELNKLFNRHFHNYGRLNNSVVDSSVDLWIDGYQASAPHKKSSIYVEGAIIALCLDLLLRKNTNSQASLDDVMRILWKEYGQKNIGYTAQDIKSACERVNNNRLDDLFEKHIDGTEDKTDLLSNLLSTIGCQLKIENNSSILEGSIGIKTTKIDEELVVISIAPESLGEYHFSIKDKIISINGMKVKDDPLKEMKEGVFDIEVIRNHAKKAIHLKTNGAKYFENYTLEKSKNPSEAQKDSYQSWLNYSF